MSASETGTAPTETPARRLPFSVKAPRDPGYATLRRASRAGIVIPLTFGFATLVGAVLVALGTLT